MFFLPHTNNSRPPASPEGEADGGQAKMAKEFG